MAQEGDIILYQSPDNGDIFVENGIVEMDGGLQTTVYLSLFGGNEDDDGLRSNKNGWWGNAVETIPARKYTSRTQYVISKIPATSANLIKLQDAVIADLKWLLDENIAQSINVDVSIPSLNKVKIAIGIFNLKQNEPSDFVFLSNWEASI